MIGVQAQPRRRTLLRVIKRIAHHRTADMRQVDANLVRPAGLGDEFE